MPTNDRGGHARGGSNGRARQQPTPKRRQAEWAGETPPHDTEAEANSLGCMLAASPQDGAGALLPFLHPDMYYAPEHRVAFEAIQAVAMRGERPEPIAVAHELARQGVLEEIGGSGFLRDLVRAWHGQPLPPIETARYLDDYRMQRVAVALKLAPLEATGRETVLRMLDELHRAERAVTPLARTWDQVLDGIEQEYTMGAHALQIPTGIREWDRKFGGLYRGRVITLTMPTGAGKTALALALARGVARNGFRVLIHSMEMGGEELGKRCIADAAQIENRDAQTGDFTDGQRHLVQDAIASMRGLPIIVRDESEPASVEFAAYESLILQYPDVALLVIDYMQLFEQDQRAKRWDDDTRAKFLDNISRYTKRLARRYQLAVLQLVQMNDDGRIRESRGIEHNSDLIAEGRVPGMFDAKGKPDPAFNSDESHTLEVHAKKNRHGPTGYITLQYIPRTQTVRDFADTSEPAPFDGPDAYTDDDPPSGPTPVQDGRLL